MERVAEEANLVEALRQGVRQQRQRGSRRMDVTELKAWMSKRAHREQLRRDSSVGAIEPTPVRGVQIPKPGGKGVRQLGIPTVIDRWCTSPAASVRTAISTRLSRNAVMGSAPDAGRTTLCGRPAVCSRRTHIVVDLDLEKFFDRVNTTS